MATLLFEAKRIMVGESVASQLLGREVGPADAYRHILLAAELTGADTCDEIPHARVRHEPRDGPRLGYASWRGGTSRRELPALSARHTISASRREW